MREYVRAGLSARGDSVCVSGGVGGGGGSTHRSPSAQKQKSVAVVCMRWLSVFMCTVCLEVFAYPCPRMGGGGWALHPLGAMGTRSQKVKLELPIFPRSHLSPSPGLPAGLGCMSWAGPTPLWEVTQGVSQGPAQDETSIDTIETDSAAS